MRHMERKGRKPGAKVIFLIISVIMLMPIVSDATYCGRKDQIEKLINSGNRVEGNRVDLDTKSLNGWIRVLYSKRRIAEHSIKLDDREIKILRDQLKACKKIQSVGRMK